MAALDDMVVRVREMLSVSATYDATRIRPAILESMQRLLRDYNFPLTVRRATFDAPGAVQKLTLPLGIKRPLGLRFADKSDNSWGDYLERREGFVLPQGLEYPTQYWIEDGELWLDTTLSLAYGTGSTAVFWYQHMIVDDASQAYLLGSFSDAVRYRTAVFLAAELRKPEVSAAFTPLWTDTLTSLAVFTNELEWSSVDMQMREPKEVRYDRYPS